MLWDLIRDFFVVNFFGGLSSGGSFYEGTFGRLFFYNGGEHGFTADLPQGDVGFPLGELFDFYDSESVSNVYITMGDWLSTTATIVVMVLFIIAIITFTIWLFKFVSGLILLKH